jgi:hypothetical protein
VLWTYQGILKNQLLSLKWKLLKNDFSVDSLIFLTTCLAAIASSNPSSIIFLEQDWESLKKKKAQQ